ncbi:hypothetical protein NQZ79_g8173 [Umbelopsis isabellina]|nr:hypothetical protein NQZ79_g8173 [Umbelopsis isabellina]
MIRQIDDTEGPVALQPLLQRFTLDAIGLVGFGFEFNSIETPDGEWVNAYNDVANGIMDFRFLLFPSLDTTFVGLFPERQKKHNNLKKLNELFATVISHKKRVLSTDQSAGEENEKDLLTLMIEAGKNEGDGVEPLTDVELRNEIVVFFLAGHDTTSNTLTAALYFLAQNPSAQDKARKEIIDILGDGKADIGPTLDQIKELRFLNLVMKESIRFASPAQVLIERRAAQDTHLVGTFIPKGSLLRINILGLHYNSHLWKTPERFDPNRFSEGGEFENHPSAYSYLPFGGGARQCIGMNFSMAEQKVALSMILRKYELSVPDDSIHKEELQFTTNILFNFAKEVKLNFKRRY